MMTRSFRPQEAVLRALSLPDARELSDEILETLRLRALLRGCQLDFTETEIADLLGVRRQTVCHAWSAYVEGGLDALSPTAPAGRWTRAARSPTSRPSVSNSNYARTSPKSGALPRLWGLAVGEWIRRPWGIVLVVRTVSLYLQR
jgi:hypothetical protein